MHKQFIIVAEDDADDRYLMQTALAESGFRENVTFVDNGVDLLHRLESIEDMTVEAGFPRLILLDLNMPKMDGREVLKKIKSHDNFRRIPVVVFSTTKNQAEVRRCYDLGANTYIVKPVSYDILVETMKQLCTYWFKTATLIDH
jgi:CheY-like chemotaxis protein